MYVNAKAELVILTPGFLNGLGCTVCCVNLHQSIFCECNNDANSERDDAFMFPFRLQG